MSLLNPLNPAAGDVPVPEDPREIEAALRAGVISYRIFPYLAWRYRERGEKFTRSDSAWLAWLTRHNGEHVDEQIAWLRNVLSNRGMPSLILEVHIKVLHRQLIRAIPGNERKYVSLMRSSERLRAMTESCITPQRQAELIDVFKSTAGPSSNPLLKHAARLLVSALADEKSGIKNAVASLEPWLIDVAALRDITSLRECLGAADCRTFDSADFARRWRAAIETTVAKARRY